MTDATSTELETFEGGTADSDIQAAIQQLRSNVPALYSSLPADSFEDKARTLSLLTDSKPLRDNLDTPISLAHVIVQEAEMPDEKGTLHKQPRILLIDTDDNAYHCISRVVFRDLQNILGIAGHPSTWEKPLTVKASRDGSGQRMFLTLSVVFTKSAKK